MASTTIDLTGSSPKPVPLGLDMHTKTQLHSTIDDIQAERLRETLHDLCNKVPDAASFAATLLLATKSKPKERGKPAKFMPLDNKDPDDDSESDTDTSDKSEEELSEDSVSQYESVTEDIVGHDEHFVGSTSRKRIRSRYVTCQNCEKEFDVTCNNKGACVYHPGM